MFCYSPSTHTPGLVGAATKKTHSSRIYLVWMLICAHVEHKLIIYANSLYAVHTTHTYINVAHTQRCNHHHHHHQCDILSLCAYSMCSFLFLSLYDMISCCLMSYIILIVCALLYVYVYKLCTLWARIHCYSLTCRLAPPSHNNVHIHNTPIRRGGIYAPRRVGGVVIVSLFDTCVCV